MHCKPTLLGPLQPAKHWKMDHWSNIEEAPVVIDFESPFSRVADDVNCGQSGCYL
jgi:chromatin modification-related protein VID21